MSSRRRWLRRGPWSTPFWKRGTKSARRGGANTLGLIGRENERLSRLINGFLAFSRLQSRHFAIADDAVDPVDIVQRAAQAVADRFDTPGSRLTTDVQPGLPRVRGDREALVTVVVNLLDNACKYTGDAKQVTLRAFADGTDVLIEVSDNGIGLSRRQARRIFDRFYRADDSLSRRGGGCGLGLSIVRFIVDAHRGAVSVDSSPGKGSTFRVLLPAMAAAGAGEAVNGS